MKLDGLTRLFAPCVAITILGCVTGGGVSAEDEWVVYEGADGPGKGKHIVFVTGDEEYRSEEGMPQMAKVLSQHHGFKCTVLFAINKETGAIDPEILDNIPGLDALATADMMVLFIRFRELPDEEMKKIIDFTNSGKPIMALRTATHPFKYLVNKKSPYAKWSFDSSDPKGGYGREVLGETWINHYGKHKFESTRGLVAEGMEDDPIVNGCEDIWGPTDVYGITKLSGDSRPVIMGQVLKGMKPDDEPQPDKKLVPVAWTKTYRGETGNTARVFTTTMGAAVDLESEGLRRLLVNATYWALEMEEVIPERANVEIVGEFEPTFYGFGNHKTGVKPADHKL